MQKFNVSLTTKPTYNFTYYTTNNRVYSHIISIIGIRRVVKIFKVKSHLNISSDKLLLPIALLFIKKTPNDFPEVSSMHMKNV